MMGSLHGGRREGAVDKTFPLRVGVVGSFLEPVREEHLHDGGVLGQESALGWVLSEPVTVVLEGGIANDGVEEVVE